MHLETEQAILLLYQTLVQNKFHDSDDPDNVEGARSVIKDNLVATIDKDCGWENGIPRQNETWWCDDTIDDTIKTKRDLRKSGRKRFAQYQNTLLQNDMRCL